MAREGKRFSASDIAKFAGLIAFIAIVAVIVVLLWPYLSDAFSEGGIDRLVERVRNAGPLGVFMLLGLQLLQIIVAFVPGEVVQLAAGLMYGPVWGTVILFVGCVISSAIIFKLVRTLGAPFVQDMVSTEHLEKFRAFERSGKLSVIVFILFLIPGLPKDGFTYLVPLTDMSMRSFLVLANVARLPGIIASTLAASSFADGDYTVTIIIAVVVVVIAALAVVFRKQLMDVLSRYAVDEREIAKSEEQRAERAE